MQSDSQADQVLAALSQGTVGLHHTKQSSATTTHQLPAFIGTIGGNMRQLDIEGINERAHFVPLGHHVGQKQHDRCPIKCHHVHSAKHTFAPFGDQIGQNSLLGFTSGYPYLIAWAS
jgi:hypothetical protein